MKVFDSSTPFILIARIKVKSGKVKEYLELAANTDSSVQSSEPGMLHHTFDQDLEDSLCFTWSEVYRNDAALLAHLGNPSVAKYLKEHAELGEAFSVEVYGTIGDECTKALLETGLPIKIFATKCGYTRV
tara:strand:- start:317 stop:706 length:390 start_codon:yes stop_codon:yes gene_type:complete